MPILATGSRSFAAGPSLCDTDLLHNGTRPGYVPGTPLPGGDGNSRHRRPLRTFFRKLQGVLAGDRVQFSTVQGTSEYLVLSTEIVEPGDTRVIESRAFRELTLIVAILFTSSARPLIGSSCMPFAYSPACRRTSSVQLCTACFGPKDENLYVPACKV
jgi:LPXTG-site transpeptidase (sortase) family protein